MNDSMSFEHVSEDGLSAVRWSFYLLRRKLVVDSYSELSRDSRRKKFTAVRWWSRCNQRDNNMAQSEVPFTVEIGQEAQ